MQISFYNVGWLFRDKKRNAANLAGLLKTILQTKGLHGLGISEVFNILDDHSYQRKHEILRIILRALMDNAEQPVWSGRADVHYIVVWNTDALQLRDYEVIGCGIDEHP